jgi:hypothetical protein
MRDGPVPADPGRDEPRPDWEPVITCPDPMTAEEWQTQLECEPVEGTDPEEYPDEEDYLSPEALNLTDAELAEIAEATRFAALAAGQATGPGDEADPAGGRMCWPRRRPRRQRGGGVRGSRGRRGGRPGSPPAGRRRSAPGSAWT